MTYKQVIFYIVETKRGLRRELIEKIGFENYDHFRSIGVLKEIFINGRPGWKSTSEAARLKNFYREPTEEEKQAGRLLAELGI